MQERLDQHEEQKRFKSQLKDMASAITSRQSEKRGFNTIEVIDDLQVTLVNPKHTSR